MANCSTRPVELPVLDVFPVEEFLLVRGEFLRWGVLLDLRAPCLGDWFAPGFPEFRRTEAVLPGWFCVVCGSRDVDNAWGGLAQFLDHPDQSVGQALIVAVLPGFRFVSQLPGAHCSLGCGESCGVGSQLNGVESWGSLVGGSAGSGGASTRAGLVSPVHSSRLGFHWGHLALWSAAREMSLGQCRPG